jgi:hypothetical protein
MSHFSKIKTTLKDLSLLQKSLNDLGISWDESINSIKGYRSQECFANLVVKILEYSGISIREQDVVSAAKSEEVQDIQTK